MIFVPNPGEPPFFLALLMDVEGSNFHVIIYSHIICASLTVIFMIASDIFVRFSRRSEPTLANAPTTIINTIPFSTLNISIALTLVVNIISGMFGIRLVMGVHASLILATLLFTNKRARKHLRLRLRQNFDSLTVGRTSNRVEPVVSISLLPIGHFRAGIQTWKWTIANPWYKLILPQRIDRNDFTMNNIHWICLFGDICMYLSRSKAYFCQ